MSKVVAEAIVDTPGTAEQVLKDAIHATLKAAGLSEDSYILSYNNARSVLLRFGRSGGGEVGANSYDPTERHEQALQAAGFQVDRRETPPCNYGPLFREFNHQGGGWKYLRVGPGAN